MQRSTLFSSNENSSIANPSESSIESNKEASKEEVIRKKLAQLTDMKVKNPEAVYQSYIENKDRDIPFIEHREENHTFLSYLVYCGFEKLIPKYLENKSLGQIVDNPFLHKVRHEYNLLHLAILSGNPKVVDLILGLKEADELLDEPTGYRELPIHLAAMIGNVEILNAITAKSKRNNVDKLVNNQTVLDLFCKYAEIDSLEFLEALFKLGASKCPEKIAYREMPVQLALESGKEKVALALLNNIKHDVESFVDASDLLVNAIKLGATSLVQVLFNECNLPLEKTMDNTHLSCCVHYGDIKLIQLVFDKESGFYKNSAFNFTDYMLGVFKALVSHAAPANVMEVYNKLVELGLNPCTVDQYGNNVFHYIASNLPSFMGAEGSYAEALIQTLLEDDNMKEMINTLNNQGETPKDKLAFYKKERQFEVAIKKID